MIKSKVLLVGLVFLGFLNLAQAKTQTINLYALEVAGVKIWHPATIVVKKGDDVVINAISKVPGQPSVHGFTIDDLKVSEVADEKGKQIRFKASEEGIFGFRCHLHPAHVGGQIVVLK